MKNSIRKKSSNVGYSIFLLKNFKSKNISNTFKYKLHILLIISISLLVDFSQLNNLTLAKPF
jgi:hypothetical protein